MTRSFQETSALNNDDERSTTFFDRNAKLAYKILALVSHSIRKRESYY